MHQSDPLLELPPTQNRWNSIRPEQEINILNSDQITSQAGRQPAQFAQPAPERAGLQGEHYFHSLSVVPVPAGAQVTKDVLITYKSFLPSALEN